MPPRTVAMIQSSYIPWKGYFDIINMADLFVFYDDVRFTKEDWRNRNRIKSRNGLHWLSVPCGSDTNRLICEVELKSSYWQRKHWSVIRHNYAKAPCFRSHAPLFEELYLGQTWERLIDLNRTFIERICRDVLGIGTPFTDSRDYVVPSGKNREERWLEIVKSIGARRFIIGPTARNYLSPEKEAAILGQGVELVWMDYSGYPEYHQGFPPFEHRVSIVDLILNEGDRAPQFMKSFGDRR